MTGVNEYDTFKTFKEKESRGELAGKNTNS
jgi:hypothetical protein